MNHQPWQCFYAIKRKDEEKDKQVLDTDKLKPDTPIDTTKHKEIKEKTEGNEYADNQFFGPWYSYKTTHTITFNGTTKDCVPNMVERLQLVKCWEITPIPKKLRK